MIIAPQTAGLSQITKDSLAVGNMLNHGPVMLMQKSNRFGMLVNVDEWNRTAKRLHDLQEIVEVLQKELKEERKGKKTHSLDDVIAMAK